MKMYLNEIVPEIFCVHVSLHNQNRKVYVKKKKVCNEDICFLLSFPAYEVLGNPHKKKVYDMTGSSTESFTGFKDVDYSHLFKQFSETLNAATGKQQKGEGFHNFNSGGFSDFSNLFSNMDAGKVNTFASQAEYLKNNELNEIIKEFSTKIHDIIGKHTKVHNSEDHYPDNQGKYDSHH